MGGADTHTQTRNQRGIILTHNHTSTAEILPSNGDEKDVEDSKWVIQIGFADNQKNCILLGVVFEVSGLGTGISQFSRGAVTGNFGIEDYTNQIGVCTQHSTQFVGAAAAAPTKRDGTNKNGRQQKQMPQTTVLAKIGIGPCPFLPPF
jgi:hypothetical protein